METYTRSTMNTNTVFVFVLNCESVGNEISESTCVHIVSLGTVQSQEVQSLSDLSVREHLATVVSAR